MALKVQLNEFMLESSMKQVADSVPDLIEGAAKQKWSLAKDKETGSFIQISKRTGSANMLFLNEKNNRVYVRVSNPVYTALKAGKEIDPKDTPVYVLDIREDRNNPKSKVIGHMLLVSFAGGSADQFEKIGADYEPEELFEVRPEPVGA